MSRGLCYLYPSQLFLFVFEQRPAYEIRLSLAGSKMCISDSFRMLMQKAEDDLPVIVEGVRVTDLLIGEAVHLVLCHDIAENWMADFPGSVS